MLNKLLVELDKVAAQALKLAAQPITPGVDVAYEAGRRIGYIGGIAAARKQMIDFYSNDNAKDNDL